VWGDGSEIGSVVGIVNGATMNEAADAIDGLRKFVRHDGLCAIIGGYGYCSCGLEAALESLSPTGVEEEAK
jgi:hypothetical protein